MSLNLKANRVLATAFVCMLAIAPGRAQDAPKGLTEEVGDVFVLSLGGKLYDNFFKMTEKKPPDSNHPLFPDYLSSDALGTWRCVACHGWDYRGSEGERGRTTKSKVFKSLAGMAGADPAVIRDRFRVVHPKYDEALLGEQAAEILALFLSGGQYDRAQILNLDKTSKGVAAHGQPIFEGACANCHQLDGRAYLRGEKGDKSSLGWIARNRPEQVIHKIMNGFPATDMLAMRFLDHTHIADLLAYLQTLDRKTK